MQVSMNPIPIDVIGLLRQSVRLIPIAFLVVPEGLQSERNLRRSSLAKTLAKSSGVHILAHYRESGPRGKICLAASGPTSLILADRFLPET
jgi:hypothetical protein